MKIKVYDFEIDIINRQIDFWQEMKKENADFEAIARHKLEAVYDILNWLNVPLDGNKENYKLVYKDKLGEEIENEE